MAAIELGVGMRSPGFNVYVCGAQGTGRRSAIEEALGRAQRTTDAVLRDHAYVANFEEPSRPRRLTLPRGEGRRLKKAIAALLARAQERIPAAIDSDHHQLQRERLAKQYRELKKQRFAVLEQKLTADHLLLMVFELEDAAPELCALVEERPTPIDAVLADPRLSEQFFAAHRLDRAGFEARVEAHREELEALLREDRRNLKELARKRHELEHGLAKKILAELSADELEELTDPVARAHVDRVADHILAELDLFREPERLPSSPWRTFEVNVVRDASRVAGPPVVIEMNPTFAGVFGVIDHPSEEDSRDAFAHIQGGSLLSADGGWLVLHARDALLEPGFWRTLIRVLRSGQLEIRPPEAGTSAYFTGVKAEPIALDVKVFLIGDDELYSTLAELDPDFLETFKVKAELDDSVENNPGNVERFAAAIRAIGRREALLPITDEALALLVEESARLADSKQRLSLRFGVLADILRESSHSAKQKGHKSIDCDSVERTIAARTARHELATCTIDRAVGDGLLRIETSGHRVGEINALAIYQSAGFSFGQLARISAAAGAGRGELVDIEREAALSGSAHDKAILILNGYLRGRYGRNRPLSLTASIAFEQSYGEVDGDSASLAELYALLSAISGVPIRQDLVVTGSVDQHGAVQAVGQVTRKVEALSRILHAKKAKGPLTCIIPSANVQSLMLGHEAVAAIRAADLHLHEISHVEEGVPLIFGVSAAELDVEIEQALERFTRHIIPAPFERTKLHH